MPKLVRRLRAHIRATRGHLKACQRASCPGLVAFVADVILPKYRLTEREILSFTKRHREPSSVQWVPCTRISAPRILTVGRCHIRLSIQRVVRAKVATIPANRRRPLTAS